MLLAVWHSPDRTANPIRLGETSRQCMTFVCIRPCAVSTARQYLPGAHPRFFTRSSSLSDSRIIRMAPSASTSVASASTRPIVISGPSGTGKSTLLQKLFDEYPDKFGFSVSHTTRAPRPGEENGKAYHFVTKEQFEDLVSQNAFIENAKFSNNLYGTSIQAVKDVAKEGKQCILDIDSQGVKLIKANHPSLDPLFVFLSPPSLSELRQRLSGRGTETPEAIATRLAASTTEIEYARTPEAYHAVVVNDDLTSAYERLKRCIVLGQWQEIGNAVPEMKEDPEEVAQHVKERN